MHIKLIKIGFNHDSKYKRGNFSTWLRFASYWCTYIKSAHFQVENWDAQARLGSVSNLPSSAWLSLGNFSSNSSLISRQCKDGPTKSKTQQRDWWSMETKNYIFCNLGIYPHQLQKRQTTESKIIARHIFRHTKIDIGISGRTCSLSQICF